MELKKSVKADLEWRKPIFFQIGLVVALLVVFLAFEFVGSRERYENIKWGTGLLDEEIAILYPSINFPPILPQQAKATDIEIVVKDAEEIENFIVDAESYEDLEINDEVDIREEMPTTDVPILFTEGYPELHGGDENYIKLVKFLQENLIYPESARKVSLEGKVYLEFTVEKNGRMTNFTILKSSAPIFGNEVARVIKLMPRWKPKKNNDRYVRKYYQIPVAFILN